MKKLNRLFAFLLCATLIIQLFGCRTKSNSTNDTASVNGATVFHALKNQVTFDSELQETENAEDLFVGLPDGSDVTLLTGPDTYSDQLGMIQVQDESDLDDAEESVNNYLQNMYDSAYAEDPSKAEKFENVAIWKNEVYIIFCITINYTSATQIINNTVNGSTPPTSDQPGGSTTASDATTAFSGTWEITGHPAVKNYYAEIGTDAEAEYFHEATKINISFSSAGVTLAYGGKSDTTQSYEITKVNGYSCLLLQLYGGDFAFILINPDMLAYTDSSDDTDYITLRIHGKDYVGSLSPRHNVFMREGSGTTNLPNHCNFSVEDTGKLSEDDTVYFYYYPTSSVFQLWVDDQYNPYQKGIFWADLLYVYESGSFEFIESISLPWADGLPAGTIYTDHNFVIADNM